MPSRVHSFIWLKGGKHSYILSCHITSWAKVNYWSLTVLVESFCDRGGIPFLLPHIVPQELVFRLWRNRDCADNWWTSYLKNKWSCAEIQSGTCWKHQTSYEVRCLLLFFIIQKWGILSIEGNLSLAIVTKKILE
jgi:hypothetical protein